MADAKKCDRCGGFYIENESIHSKGRVNGGVIGGIYTVTINDDRDEYFDLCDPCLKKLFKFLNNEELFGELEEA